MTTINELDRAKLEALATTYGADALLLWLVGSYESRAAGLDRTTRNILKDFAQDLRNCVRRREDSHQLAGYRRDWSGLQWSDYLRTLVEHEGLILHSERVSALERAGCQSPIKVSIEYSEALRESLAILLITDADWLRDIAAAEQTLSRALNETDLVCWLTERGFQGHSGIVVTWLREHRDQLPAELQRLVLKGHARKASASAPAAAVDPNDESVFDAPEKEAP